MEDVADGNAAPRSATRAPGAGEPPRALLSHRLWQRRFAGNLDVLGRRLAIGGGGVTVVGVMPAEFRLPSGFTTRRAEIYLPPFGVMGLVLVAVGVYGVMAYTAAQRTRELGVRMALGAGPRQVMGLVIGQGLALSLVGVAVGIGGALALSRVLAGMLFGIGSRDPVTLVAIPILLTLVALAACYLPARRATRVDPMAALRSE